MKLQPTRKAVEKFLRTRARELKALLRQKNSKNVRRGNSILEYEAALLNAIPAIDTEEKAQGFWHGYNVALAEARLRTPEIAETPEMHSAVQSHKAAKRRTKHGSLIQGLVSDGLGTTEIRKQLGSQKSRAKLAARFDTTIEELPRRGGWKIGDETVAPERLPDLVSKEKKRQSR